MSEAIYDVWPHLPAITTMKLGSAQAWAAADMTSAEKNSRAPERARFVVDVAMAELAEVSSGCDVDGC